MVSWGIKRIYIAEDKRSQTTLNEIVIHLKSAYELTKYLQMANDPKSFDEALRIMNEAMNMTLALRTDMHLSPVTKEAMSGPLPCPGCGKECKDVTFLFNHAKNLASVYRNFECMRAIEAKLRE